MVSPPEEREKSGSTTGEVPEQTPADGNNQDGASQRQSNAHNIADSTFHLGGSGGQSADQFSDQGRGSTFHGFSFLTDSKPIGQRPI